MARPATGSVVERPSQDGIAFAIRFRAYGQREQITLGTSAEGWSKSKAEVELSNVLADVRRGIWQRHEPEPVEAPGETPTFHEFASDWLAGKKAELRSKTISDYEWALSVHLLPFFATFQLHEITAEAVDRYRSAKMGEGKLGANGINKTLSRLAQILELAVEYDHIPKNNAKGKPRRAKGTKPKRSWVEPEQLMTLIAAGDSHTRPMIATLAGAGLRVGEAVALNWRDVNLSTGTITVRESKTDAGEGREVDMPLGLQEELAGWRANSPKARLSDPVFVGRLRDGEAPRMTERTAHRRLRTAVKAANKKLAPLGIEQIGNVSPHSLRRSFASLRYASGDDLIYVKEQGGWRDVRFPMQAYAKAVRRRSKLKGEHLRQFDAALDWARLGTSAESAEAVPNAPADVNSPERALR